MRVLVYAAGAYALGIGAAEAFAPARTCASGDVCSGPGCFSSPGTGRSVRRNPSSPSLRMMGAGADRQASGTEDAADVMARANSMVQGKSIHTVAASFEAAFAAPSAASVENRGTAQPTSWTPPVGYVPRRASASADAEDSLMSKVTDMIASVSTASDPVQKSWTPPAGYNPGQDLMSSASAKTWAPPAGYIPHSKAQGQLDTLSSAPAKKWQPYGGYDPKNRRSAAPNDSVSSPMPPSNWLDSIWPSCLLLDMMLHVGYFS